MTSDGVSAILLDVDDTLIDTRAAMIEAATAGFRAVCPDISPEARAAAAVRFHRDPGRHFAAYSQGRVTFADMRAARFREVMEAFQLGPCCDPGRDEHGESRFSVFEDRYSAALRGAIRAFPDAVAFLGRARAAGVPVGVLTNSSDAATRMKLDAAGLADLVGAVVTTDTLGFGKPDRRVFEHACRTVGAPPARTAYVGDDLATDAVGARDAGLVAHWLVRDGSGVAPPEGVVLVSSLEDVDAAAAPRFGSGSVRR